VKPYRVIVAEDNRVLQDVIRFNLARAGFEVRTAVEGTQALRLLEEQPADVLVTDCQMPGMSGLELCAAVRSHAIYSNLPILFCSAKGLEIEPKRLKNFGCQQFCANHSVLGHLSRKFSRSQNPDQKHPSTVTEFVH
jgi:two-component system sensor histidine kinase EvgS